ncbi:ATP-binding protein [Sphaerisporangium sp. NPDC051017]|uniref:ATP-binding protein n=1 Tax=Sphaerisporangium sp. NPDC051017 TaxID=3154636 RepID=UPI0034435078
MITIPGRLRSAAWDIPYDLAAVCGVRHRVQEALTSWGLAELADDVVLVAGELLGNAVSHGGPPIRLSLWRTRGALCVRVTDHGTGRPRQLDVGLDAVRGRGLAIVEALAGEFGIISRDGRPGTVVWAKWAVKHDLAFDRASVPEQRQP